MPWGSPQFGVISGSNGSARWVDDGHRIGVLEWTAVHPFHAAPLVDDLGPILPPRSTHSSERPLEAFTRTLPAGIASRSSEALAKSIRPRTKQASPARAKG